MRLPKGVRFETIFHGVVSPLEIVRGELHAVGIVVQLAHVHAAEDLPPRVHVAGIGHHGQGHPVLRFVDQHGGRGGEADPAEDAERALGLLDRREVEDPEESEEEEATGAAAAEESDEDLDLDAI